MRRGHTSAHLQTKTLLRKLLAGEGFLCARNHVSKISTTLIGEAAAPLTEAPDYGRVAATTFAAWSI